MNRTEFCQTQVEQIDRQLFEVRSQIEHLMQVDSYLTTQRETWVGRLAMQDVILFPSRSTLTLIQGGSNDTNPGA